MMRGLLIALMAVIGLSLAPVPATAMTTQSPLTQMAVCTPNDPLATIFGFQSWYACLQKKYNGETKITSINDIFLILFPLVESIVKLAVLVAAGMVFFMLFKMATANGNSSTVATALGGMRDAVVGLIIAMVSVAIVNFVAGAFV